MTGGAALPVDPSVAGRIAEGLMRAGYNPEALDFKRITPRQEAEVAALMIGLAQRAVLT